MREIVHLQAGQCGNQIGAKVYAVDLQSFRNMIVRCASKVPRSTSVDGLLHSQRDVVWPSYAIIRYARRMRVTGWKVTKM